MTTELDTILDQLNSDENRLKFLESIYRRGDIDVADRIFELSDHPRSVITKEIAFAREHNQDDRARYLGMRLVDNDVGADLDTLLHSEILKQDDVVVARHAIARFCEKGSEESLKYAAELAVKFAPEEVNRILEQLFDEQSRRCKDDFQFTPADTAVKLGRFEEAIDLYMKAGYNWLDRALAVAKEHSPERVASIATRGFDEYNAHRQVFYVDCARCLDKEEEARATLVREARRLTVNVHPGAYHGLVRALVSVERPADARAVADKVEAYELQQMKKQRHYQGTNQRGLASIFETLGDHTRAVQALVRKIDLEFDRHPSHFMPDIDSVFRLTGDLDMLDRKRIVFERQGEYLKAAAVAREVGKPELAEAYETMQRMTEPEES